MDTARFGVKPREHIPGYVINKYLKAYASEFGIADLIRFNTKVTTAEHQDGTEGGWILTVATKGQEGTVTTQLYARRMILATGLTSEPFLPHFKGQEEYGGRIFHSKHFLDNSDTLQTAKSVTVFGATKFGWDAVYSYARAGIKVNWIIRCRSFHLLNHIYVSWLIRS